MADFRSRLGIGTVQFGLDYGISNKTGKTAPSEARVILENAQNNNIRVIDTARLYGNSENVLGESIPERNNFKIVTKTAPIKKDHIDAADRQTMHNGLRMSLQSLKMESVYGLLLHHADDLSADGGEGIYEDLLTWKNKGLVQKIGISAYNSDQIDKVLSKYEIDLIQIPVNVFDQRMVKDGTLERLAAKNIEIHVRSAFLQGICFMTPESLPYYLQDLQKPLVEFREICSRHGLTSAAGALAFLLGLPQIGTVVCGINTAGQLKELCDQAAALPSLPKDCFDNIAVDRADLVNPALWTRI